MELDSKCTKCENTLVCMGIKNKDGKHYDCYKCVRCGEEYEYEFKLHKDLKD
jgi:hypothetical protein